MQTTADFSWETTEARTQRNDVLKVLKEKKSVNLKLTCSENISQNFKIKIFLDK